MTFGNLHLLFQLFSGGTRSVPCALFIIIVNLVRYFTKFEDTKHCKIGNKPQFKKCVRDDIRKFKYSEPTDRKTTFNSQEPPWCKRVRTAGEKVLVSLPGMPVDYIWNRTICQQRDDVFMTAYWECESVKSQLALYKQRLPLTNA